MWGDHIDTVDRAGFHTQITAGALTADDSVHLLGRTENGVDRAGLYTFGTPDTFRLANKGDRWCSGDFAVFRVQRQWFNVQQVRQGLDASFPAGWTFVDVLAVGNRFGIGPAAWVTTLTALGLGKNIVDLIGNRVALGLEPHGSKT